MTSSHKETIIVTGASGLIGAPVIRRLADRFHIVAFDRRHPPAPPPVAEEINVDLTSDELVRQGLAATRKRHGSHIAAVIHLAAYYDFSGEPSPLYDEVTVRGTLRLLQGLRDFTVERFIFSSTMLVHAPCEPGQRINEDWPIEAKWPYPQSKIETERVIHAHRGDMPVAILRISGVYDDVCHSIPLAHQIQRIHERRLTSHVFPGDISHGQSFMHLDDLVEAIARVVERRRTLPDEVTLLLGEEETLSYDELQRLFGRAIHGEEWETREIPKAAAKAGAWAQGAVPGVDDPFIKPWMIDLADDHYALDTSRARALLDWRPQRSLRQTIPLMVERLKRDPDAWYREHGLTPPGE